MPTRSYRELIVWQKSMRLVGEAYRLAARLPAHERFGLCTQMRRAAVAVPANIAEGHARAGLGEYLYHLSVASGSLAETETHLLLAAQLGYLPVGEFDGALEQTAEVGRMLHGLKRSLQAIPRDRNGAKRRAPGT